MEQSKDTIISGNNMRYNIAWNFFDSHMLKVLPLHAYTDTGSDLIQVRKKKNLFRSNPIKATWLISDILCDILKKRP